MFNPQKDELMKKKNLFLFIATALLLSVSVFAASKGSFKGSWSAVSDSCGKCQVNYIDRVCGKCGGFLEQDGKDNFKGDYCETTYKCKDCSHTCKFKVKYK